MNFKNWIYEYNIDPSFDEIGIKKPSLRQATKALQVDKSKFGLIPFVLSKKTILLVQKIRSKMIGQFLDAWNVIDRLQEQGDNVSGSNEILVVYISNLEAMSLKDLANQLLNSSSIELVSAGRQILASVDRGTSVVSVQKLK